MEDNSDMSSPVRGPVEPDVMQDGPGMNSEQTSMEGRNAPMYESTGHVEAKVKRFRRNDVQSPQPDGFSFGKPEARPMDFRTGAARRRPDPQAPALAQHLSAPSAQAGVALEDLKATTKASTEDMMEVDDNVISIVPALGIEKGSNHASPVQEHSVGHLHVDQTRPQPDNNTNQANRRTVLDEQAVSELVNTAVNPKHAQQDAPSQPIAHRTPDHPIATTHTANGPTTPQPHRQHRQKRAKAPSQAELLDLLAFRMQQDRKAQDNKEDDWKRTYEELEASKSENRELSSRLDELLSREVASEGKIAAYQQSVLALKSKLKKLDDYLRGLTNDYHKVRDSSRRILEKQEALSEDRRVIKESVGDANAALERIQNSTRDTFSRGRDEISGLQVSLKLSQKEVESKHQLVEEERQRSCRLEGEIERLASTQQKILEGIDANTQKADAGFKSMVENKDHFSTSINSLVSGLNDIKARLNFDKADLDKIDISFREFAAKLIEILDQSTERSSTARTESDRVANNVVHALSDLERAFQSEQSWAEKLNMLREELSGLKENLQNKDSDIQTLKNTILELRGIEKAKCQEVTILNGQIAQLQSRDDGTALSAKLQELETLNSQGDVEIAALRLKNSDLAARIQEQEDTARNKDDEVLQVRTRLLEVERSAELAISEAAAFDQMRTDLLKAADIEKIRLRQKHTKAIMDLKQAKESVEHVLLRLEKDLKASKYACNEKMEEANKLRNELKSAHEESETQVRAATCLQDSVKNLKQAGISKDSVIKTLQHEITDHKLAIENKDKELLEFQSSIKSLEQLVLSRGLEIKSLQTEIAKNPFAIFRSQPNILDETRDAQECHPDGLDSQDLAYTQPLHPVEDTLPISGESSHTLQGRELEADDAAMGSQRSGHAAVVHSPRDRVTTENLQSLTSPVGETKDLFPPTPTQALASDPLSDRKRTSNSSARRIPGSSAIPSALARHAFPNAATTNKFAASERGESSVASTQDSNSTQGSNRLSQKSSVKNKPSTSLKRQSADARLETDGEPKTKKRTSKSATKGLGPIIGDSTSPDPIARAKQGGRSKRNTKENQKADKFSRRFSEGLKEAGDE